MVIIMSRHAEEADVQAVVDRVEDSGLTPYLLRGVERTVIGVLGHVGDIAESARGIELMRGVESLVPVTHPFKLCSRDFKEEDTIVRVGNADIGGQEVVAIAGPCSVESAEQVLETALAVRDSGAKLLRGGAYKPRTSPYSFRGMGVAGLEILAETREKTGLGIVTEVMSSDELDVVCEFADMLQIGTRNMQNYPLLEAVGRRDLPVLLKRGRSATIEEWLLSAEYIMAQGNHRVVLCERGITSFDTYTRNTFDINAIPLAKTLSHLPVIGDPSHGTGKASLVGPVARAAVAAGADGVIVEVHPDPEHALSDSAQQLTFGAFDQLMTELGSVARAVGRSAPQTVTVG